MANHSWRYASIRRAGTSGQNKCRSGKGTCLAVASTNERPPFSRVTSKPEVRAPYLGRIRCHTAAVRKQPAIVGYAGFGTNAVHQPLGLMAPEITLHVPSSVAVFPGTNRAHTEHFCLPFGVD